MSVTIPQDIIDQAKILNAAGDLVGAYQLLADAGDTYAARALDIVDGVPDIMENTVKDLWEKVDPGSVDRSWDDVAAQHQSQYLDLIETKYGELPDTYAIELSYADALSCISSDFI